MSNGMISVPRERLEYCLRRSEIFDDGADGADDESARSVADVLRALLAKPDAQHQGNAVAAEVCAYTPGMGQVELKLPGNLPSWMELGETVTVLHGDAQPQGEPIRLTAVAELIDNGDGGLEPSWLLEGGTAELFPGMVLLVADNAPKLCEEDGSAEVYTRPAEQPAQKYDDTLLPFMELMRRELHANSHKGDRPEWLKMTASTALEEIAHHFNKLDEAVGARDNPQIREYAADIANICMMLLDICGELAFVRQPEPVSSTSDKYKAELYDEVWQLARDMGFGNVTDALMKLEKQPATPVFAQTVLAKLERFQECGLDDQDSDIGRDWFDVLVQLGLLNRVQRSPALWEITDEGIAVLEDHAEQPAPVAVVLPRRRIIRAENPAARISHSQGWNACLDEVARLNPPQQ